jgi:hypothetical protein
MSQKSRHPSTPATERLCGGDCGRPAFNSFLCGDCADELWRQLLTVCQGPLDANDQRSPNLVDELHTTIAGLARISGRNVGIPVRSAETPLPWNERASEALAHLHSVLASWVFTVSGYHGIAVDIITTPVESAEWLLRFHNLLRTTDIAGQAHEEIREAIRQAEWAIDRPAERQYAGPCDPECGGQVFGKPDSNIARCDTCELTYDLDERRAFLLQAAEDYLVTAAEASKALPAFLGRPVNVKTIRNWANTDDKLTGSRRLVRHGVDPETDTALYRLGDIVDLAVVTQMRIRRPKEPAETPPAPVLLDTPA